jgi:hypothetical protein
MARDAASFSIMNLQGGDRSRTHCLHVLQSILTLKVKYEKVDIMCRGVKDGKKKEHISSLSMEP